MSRSVGRITPGIGPVILAATMTATGLAAAPGAMAKPVSPIAPVRVHVHKADVALHAVASAAARGKVTIPLSVLTSQLGVAANLSATLAVNADTPNLERVASSALNLVASEEAKARALLGAELSAVSKVQADAVLRADLAVTQGEQLALSGITQLEVTSQAKVSKLKVTIGSLAVKAKALLVGIVGQLPASVSGSLSVGGSGQVDVDGTPVDMQAVLNPVGLGIGVISDILDGGTSLVGDLVSQELVQVQLQLDAQGDPSASTTTGTAASGTGSVQAGGSATATGSANASGLFGLGL